MLAIASNSQHYHVKLTEVITNHLNHYTD